MARSFNGTSDKIAVNAAHVTNGSNTQFTIALWVKSSLANANARDPYCEGNSGAAGPFFQIQGDANGHVVVAARSGVSGTADTLTGSVAVAFDGTWHHVCVTQNPTGTTFFLFVDGVADGSKARTGFSNSGAQVFNTTTIGAAVRNTTASFYGGIAAHVATWTRQLATSEIQSLAAGLLPSHLGPDHYWPLWGTDSPEPDIGTATHVAGTLTGTSQAAGGPPTGKQLLTLGAV